MLDRGAIRASGARRLGGAGRVAGLAGTGPGSTPWRPSKPSRTAAAGRTGWAAAAGARYAVPIALPMRAAADAAPPGAVAVAGRVGWVEAEFGWRAAFELNGQTWGVGGASLDEAFRALVGGAALRLRQ